MRGEIDLAAARSVRTEIADAFACHSAHVRIDLQDVTFMDSTGLNLLALAHRAAVVAGVVLTIVPGPPSVMRALELSGLDELFTFEPGTWSAAAAD
jgi:anti-sigma B factor antagonist